MKTLVIKGDIRSNTGKVSSKELRNEGKVPCVVYGGTDHIHFAVYSADLKALIYTPNTYLVSLEVSGKTITSHLKDVQFHPVSDEILHVDFQEIVAGKPVTLNIPVKIKGNAAGVRAGGRLAHRIKRLRLHGEAKDMPDFIEVDVEKLEIGQGIRVRDISVPNIEILDAAANTIIAVEVTRASQQAEATAPAAATPAKTAEPAKDAAPAAAPPKKK
jgi:large subunit ribosomal protein L25